MSVRPPASDVPSDVTGATGLTPAPSMRRPSVAKPTRSKSHKSSRSTKSRRTKRQTAKSLPRTISVHSFDTSDDYRLDDPASPLRPTSMPYTITQAHRIDLDNLTLAGTLAGGPSRPASRNASRPQSTGSGQCNSYRGHDFYSYALLQYGKLISGIGQGRAASLLSPALGMRLQYRHYHRRMQVSLNIIALFITQSSISTITNSSTEKDNASPSKEPHAFWTKTTSSYTYPVHLLFRFE